jgi:ComF family protein
MRCRERGFSFDSAYPLWEYSGRIKDLLISYKIRGVRPLAHFFASRVYDRLLEGYPEIPLVPVPYRRGKIRKTGWDQVEDLARSLERRGVPVVRCLKRAEGASQKTLDFSARLSNLTGKIRFREGTEAPERVVLLDDVLTTGATLSECARVLKNAGAQRVDALVLAAD